MREWIEFRSFFAYCGNSLYEITLPKSVDTCIEGGEKTSEMPLHSTEIISSLEVFLSGFNRIWLLETPLVMNELH